MVVFVEHSLCRKPKLQKMNRSEIPSDVAPSEIHIGDQISDYKMLSGKILHVDLCSSAMEQIWPIMGFLGEEIPR